MLIDGRFRYFILFLILIRSNVTVEQSAPDSPCPTIMSYIRNGNTWYGLINLPSSDYGSRIKLHVKLSLNGRLPTKYVGELEMLDDTNEAIRKILTGDSLRYRIVFPLQKPIPLITSITVNEEVICSGEPSIGDFVTSIDLESVFVSNNNNRNNDRVNFNNNRNNIYNNNERIRNEDQTERFTRYTTTERLRQYTTTERYIPPTTTEYFPKTRYTVATSSSDTNQDCGIIEKKSVALIFGGTATNPGDWPWLTAIFHKRVEGLSFICSGSLISNNHIITAAHCVFERNREMTQPNDLVVKLGAYNIQDWTDQNAKIMDVVKISAHPQFNITNLRHDIAILHVNNIDFTNWYRPVCLWLEDTNQQTIVGKTGSVVGWGLTENGLNVSPVPKMSHLPIVSLETCRGSNPDFFLLTSENTLCAGNKDGTGPCKGDSGGGLYLLENNRWMIRGIVSSSLANKDSEYSSPCSLTDYVIFTDTARYLEWTTSILINS